MPSDIDVKSELDLGEPSPELLKWAKENIREDPETRCQDLSDFRDLIYSRGECAPHRTDDAFLLRFLRARHFVIESAHRLLVNYYDFKDENPDYFENASLADLERIGPHDIITVPPYREQMGRRLLLYRLGNWDPGKFTIADVFKASMLVLELAILEQQAQILGGVCIFDLGNLSMQQAWHMNPNIASKVVEIFVTSFPMKCQALHIVNQSWIFDTVYNLFKPFVNDKMKQRIHFHGENMDSLHKHVDPKFLPERYGGIHPDYNYNDWIVGFKKDEVILNEMKTLGYKVEGKDIIAKCL